MRIKPKGLFAVFTILTFSVVDAEIWTGPPITFTKASGSDWTLTENQDWLTENVAITRTNSQGIFNIAQEQTYSSVSPSDTEWALGTTGDIGALSFETWVNYASSNPPGLLGLDSVVHLITDDIYIDIQFTSWQRSRGGGEFSYIRSTKPVPEPSTNFLICGVGLFLAFRRGRVFRRRKRK